MFQTRLELVGLLGHLKKVEYAKSLGAGQHSQSTTRVSTVISTNPWWSRGHVAAKKSPKLATGGGAWLKSSLDVLP